MLAFLTAVMTVFGLGIVYYIAAIPAGVALHLPAAVAAVAAWAGYTVTGAAMLLIGTPARNWIKTRFKISAEPNPEKLFWKIWLRGGMPGLGLIAPVTCGPYIAALFALALGEKPRRLMFWIALGAIPWSIAFAVISAFGWHLTGK